MERNRGVAFRLWSRGSLWSLVLLSLTSLACTKSNFKGSSGAASVVTTKKFTQEAYPEARHQFVQGDLGEPQTQEFEQGEWSPLDVLVVVDNSQSMAEEQANLSTKLEPLLSEVADSDWKISVVTTDPLLAGNCTQAVIDKNDADPIAAFKNAVDAAGTDGDANERGILQAVRGLKGECLGQEWLRENSTVAVLIVSDEDNCHVNNNDGYGCEGQADLQGTYLTDYLSSIRTVGETAKVYGLLWHPDTPGAECSTGFKTGNIYADVIDATSGTWGSICEDDYTKTLEEISGDIAQILSAEIALENEPTEGTVEVTVDGQSWDQFTVEGSTVQFTETPPFGSKINIAYRHGPDGDYLNDVSLEKPAVDGTFVVTVDDKELFDGYSYNAETNSINFGDAPAENLAVVVAYNEKVELPKDFELGLNVRADSISITVAGEPVDSFTYDATTGYLTFDEAPAAEAEILVRYKTRR